MFAGDMKLTGKKRTLLGKKVKQLRREGSVPANIFGDVKESQAITLNTREFVKVYKEAGDTSVIALSIDGETKGRPVLVDSVEYHPLHQTVMHVSFRQVNLKEKISAEVPIELINQLEIKEVTPVLLRESIEVEALPNDLPEAFEIDLAKFTEVGQEVTIAQLPYDHSKVEILEDDLEQVVLQIQEVKQMEEVVEETPVAEGAETTEQTEGEAEKKEEDAEVKKEE